MGTADARRDDAISLNFERFRMQAMIDGSMRSEGRPRVERQAGWARAVRRHAAIVACALLAACAGEQHGTAPGVDGGAAALGMNLAVNAPTATAVELRATASVAEARIVELAHETIPLDAGTMPPVHFAIDLAPCLGQIPGVIGCDVYVEITLKRDGTVLDRQVIGPIRLVPGQSTSVTKPVALYEVSSIQITTPTGGAPSLESGDTLQLAAAVVDGKGTVVPGRPITWSNSNPTVATVDDSGRVVALAPGTTQISAASGGQTSAIAVTVAPPAVATIAIVPGSTRLDAGRPITLSVVLRDKRGTILTGRLITFSSSDVTRATVSATGVLLGLKLGDVDITATSEGKSASLRFTVAPGVPASVTISPRPSLLEQGQTAQLAATVKDVQGNGRTDVTVSWQSTDPATASVSATGLLVAANPSTTPVHIIASAPTAGGKTVADTVTVVVVPIGIASVTLKTLTPILEVGATVQPALTVIGARGQTVVGRPVAWRSSDPAVASVDPTGTVRGIAPGNADITATVDGVSGTVALHVIPPQVASVVISPAAATIDWGGYVQLEAVAVDARGNPVPGVTSFSWSSSDPNTANVDSIGGVYGEYPGTVVISAAYGNIVGAVQVTVQYFSGCGGSTSVAPRPVKVPAPAKKPSKRP